MGAIIRSLDCYPTETEIRDMLQEVEEEEPTGEPKKIPATILVVNQYLLQSEPIEVWITCIASPYKNVTQLFPSASHYRVYKTGEISANDDTSTTREKVQLQSMHSLIGTVIFMGNIITTLQISACK